MAILKERHLCINCLKSGHFVNQYKSKYRCRICQKPHHSLMHIDAPNPDTETATALTHTTEPIVSHMAAAFKANPLLMTCKLFIEAPNGSMMEVRGLIDSASSISFVTERILQTLRMPRSACDAKFSGIAGMTHSSTVQAVGTFNVAPTGSPDERMNITAIILPRVTYDLPTFPVSFNSQWSYLTDLILADPTFGIPGRIDVVLGVDVFASCLLQGQRSGPPNTPTAVETHFGWVLAGQNRK